MPSIDQIVLLLALAAPVYVMERLRIRARVRPAVVVSRHTRIRRANVEPVYQTDGGCASDF